MHVHSGCSRKVVMYGLSQLIHFSAIQRHSFLMEMIKKSVKQKFILESEHTISKFSSCWSSSQTERETVERWAGWGDKLSKNGELRALSPNYKYLGLMMSSKLAWTPTQRTLSLQSDKSMNLIQRINYECNFSFISSNKLFDKWIILIATHGSEICQCS